MSIYKVGDRVRVTQMTDLDEEIGSEKRVMRDNDSIRRDVGGEYGPMIEDTATVVEVYSSDYCDVSIKLDRDTGRNEDWAMVDEDLERIDG